MSLYIVAALLLTPTTTSHEHCLLQRFIHGAWHVSSKSFLPPNAWTRHKGMWIGFSSILVLRCTVRSIDACSYTMWCQWVWCTIILCIVVLWTKLSLSLTCESIPHMTFYTTTKHSQLHKLWHTFVYTDGVCCMTSDQGHIIIITRKNFQLRQSTNYYISKILSVTHTITTLRL